MTLSESTPHDLSLIADLYSAEAPFESALEKLFDGFEQVIPYDRIGVARISPDRERVELVWIKSRNPAYALKRGYSAPLKGSSLAKILDSSEPRIISDLLAYQALHPESESTRLAIKDGLRSSLTCALRGGRGTSGFIFYSSYVAKTYKPIHLQIFSLISYSIAAALDRNVERDRQAEQVHRDALFAKVLHDLRNPLSTISLQVGLALKNGSIDPKSKASLSSLATSVKDMTRLLEDFQNALQLGRADFPIVRQPVVLEEFLATIDSASQCLAAAKSINFELNARSELPEQAFLDPQRMTQVLGNLLSNALKFSRPRTTIQLTVEQREDRLEFHLKDEGIGMSRGQLYNLFEARKNHERSAPQNFERCQGLGLRIVRQIVTDHGGDIWVESQLGIGSTFSISLPLTNPEKVAAETLQ